MAHMQAWRRWLEHPGMPEELMQQLQLIKDDEQAIRDHFFGGLAFGTGGLCGRMGAGSNRINDYTVNRVSRGLAAYLLKQGDMPSCVIGFDSRLNSQHYAQLAAAALAERGVRVHLFEELVPAPMVSFAVRYLRCDAGVVITAGHSPSDYNGYKVYDATGCQLLHEAARQVSASIETELELCTRFPDLEQLTRKGFVRPVAWEVRDAYSDAVLKLSILTPPAVLKVVYSPLHGAGMRTIRKVLGAMPNVELSVVATQEQPDGTFPTVEQPNPTDPVALELAAQQMLEEEADICLATDPDCGRLGVGVRLKDAVHFLSGNELAALLTHFICEGLTNQEQMPPCATAVKTIGISPMVDVIAKHYDVRTAQVLTDFKYIGETINRLNRDGVVQRFVLGIEEGNGYLSGSHVRDRDGVNAAMLVCEMASYYKSVNSNLLDAYQALRRRFGCFKTAVEKLQLEGEQGAARMGRIMAALRGADAIGEWTVEERVDFLKDNTGLPASDVLALTLEGNRQLVARPSDTEPTLQLRLTVGCPDAQEAQAQLALLQAAVAEWVALVP